MIDSKLVILFFTPNLRQLGLNPPFENLDQFPIRLHHLPLRLNLLDNPIKTLDLKIKSGVTVLLRASALFLIKPEKRKRPDQQERQKNRITNA